MFDGCKSLISLDLSNFNTNNVTNMDYMFADCFSLLSLDLSNFNIQNVAYMRNFLYGCNSLNNLKSNFYNMMNNNNIMNNNFPNNNMMMNNNIMMNNYNNLYPNNNQMINGNNLMNYMNNNNGYNHNNNNSSTNINDEIFVKEHPHKLVYCISILDWNCFICKKNYDKNKVKYYCSLCDFNLCKKCHSERNLPKVIEFNEEVKPSNLSIKNPIFKSEFHEHNLIYCRTSRLKDILIGWYCNVCFKSFTNEIWSFYCTNCDYDLCCKCAGFN